MEQISDQRLKKKQSIPSSPKSSYEEKRITAIRTPTWKKKGKPHTGVPRIEIARTPYPGGSPVAAQSSAPWRGSLSSTVTSQVAIGKNVLSEDRSSCFHLWVSFWTNFVQLITGFLSWSTLTFQNHRLILHTGNFIWSSSIKACIHIFPFQEFNFSSSKTEWSSKLTFKLKTCLYIEYIHYIKII